MKIPANEQTVMPYLILTDAEKFIDFVQVVFDATISLKHLTEEGNIRHAQAVIGGCTLMFAQTKADWGAATAHLFIYVANADERYAIALANGASSVSAPSDQPYGRACGILDPCGNTWWITSLTA